MDLHLTFCDPTAIKSNWGPTNDNKINLGSAAKAEL